MIKGRRSPARVLLFACIGILANGCGSRTDDAARKTPANAGPGLRIVTLAPHLAELTFLVGAGDALVGVSSWTDYPEAARSLPVVGDAFSIDQERLALLRPDLLLAWKSGTPARVVDELRERGYRVATIETRGLDDISAAIVRIGALTHHVDKARAAAADFRAGLRQLAGQYQGSEPVRVFYQVSERPLYTVNGDHYVSELIGICGGMNIFSDLRTLAPMVGVEAVLARDPEAMLATDDSPPDAFDVWKRWPELAANRYGNYFFLPADEIARPTPRLLQAGKSLCDVLDRARRNRETYIRAASSAAHPSRHVNTAPVPDDFLTRFRARQKPRDDEKQVRQPVQIA